ncbi:MAG: hypothetical protein NTW29_08240 [Bacteroidetes bacterium]|nr:hypothetical protein [Bacteroidota bacterium]
MKSKAIIISILSFLLLILSFYHFKFRDVFLVKAGTSHFFSPGLVGFLSYLLPGLSIAAALLLWFKESKSAGAAIAGLLSLGYLTYVLLILNIGDASCDCANLFPDIPFKWQIVLFLLPLLMCLFLFLNKRLVRSS